MNVEGRFSPALGFPCHSHNKAAANAPGKLERMDWTMKLKLPWLRPCRC